ncbi:MAG TPA: hypothetical protein VJS92_13825 [Candidatus Polarisedimenticolaceae bacterium]|nr:hypothetical protein [Candidatus Polarisedimenticolaceae bacterium]
MKNSWIALAGLITAAVAYAAATGTGWTTAAAFIVAAVCSSLTVGTLLVARRRPQVSSRERLGLLLTTGSLMLALGSTRLDGSPEPVALIAVGAGLLVLGWSAVEALRLRRVARKVSRPS